jgi:hypothetical protein
MSKKCSNQSNISGITSKESSLSSEVSTKIEYLSVNERGVCFYNVENACDSCWIPFGDIDNEIIEEAFSKNRKKIQLDNYLIDLDRLIQIDKQDSSIERPIKRCIRQLHETPLRSERFYSPEKLVKSFTNNDTNDHRFINEYHKRYSTKSIDEMLEKAAEGIIKEGILLGQQIEAEWIAQRIRSVIGKSKAEVEKCIISLYTYETFLYRLINTTLRENDQSKFDTLGRFIQLLFHCDCSPTLEKVGYDGQLYRGAQLDDKTIESYKQSIGLVKTWDAFSSTSKNRAKAECYGNVLFIINRHKSTRYRFSGMDISAISHYPEEEEVLIRAARNFIVEKVEKDNDNGKYIIFLSLC